MFDLIATPFAFIMRFIYDLVNNYGLTIIIFTVLTKLILWPLTATSQKSMLSMQKIQPELSKLQEKYKNDKDKLGQETMKLYKDNNVNPMGGCLPLLLQFPLIIAIYQVIIKPITYLSDVKMGIPAIVDMLHKSGLGAGLTKSSQEIQILKAVADSDLAQKIEGFVNIDFNFLGLDLSQIPSAVIGDWTTNFVWIIPVLSLLSAFAMSKVTSSMNSNNASAGNEQAQQTQKVMTMMMPLMSGYFTFIFPSGVGLYWIASNVLQVVQQIIITKTIRQKAEVLAVKAVDVKIKNKNTK
ncbi:MAG: YidC/Oxa1 family membrane protein insertase [Eubacteriales bacterium]|nr:YidC/Oxa1 family membrane protein insertase [Eubacteriales bacterium]